MNAELLQRIIEGAGYEVTRYSGRAMYGAECPGIVVENAFEAIATITLAMLEDVDENTIARTWRGARDDNMGRDDVVIYFPLICYVEEEHA
jgi:hypothetical protein